MQKIFIIDASGYLYSSYFAIRNMTNAKGESTNALFGFIRSVLKLIKDFQPSHLVAVFDGPRNGIKREKIYPEYKAHRTAAPQDLYYQISWAQEFCTLMGIPFLNIPEVEADDTMGTIAKWSAEMGSEAYICTSDKDMCQIVNGHVHLLNTRKDNYIIGPSQVEEIHGVPPDKIVDLFAMIGDASDNIPGIPGVGPKTALALLKQFGSLDNMLAHSEEIESEKRRAAIVENKENALLSRSLVALDLNVDIPASEDFYLIKSPHSQEVKSFYTQMNFLSLLKEFEAYSQKTFDFEMPSSIQAETTLLQSNYVLVDNQKSLSDMVEILKKQKRICFDTETTQIRPITAELVGIGFCFEPEHAWYVPVNGSLDAAFVLEALKPLFENPAIGFYGHNVKYDYHVLANHGVKIANICFDSLLASYLLNSHNRQHSLDQLALQYFGKVKIPISDLIGKGKKAVTMREVPLEKVCEYCCEDADYACRLMLTLEKELKERSLEKLMYEIELPLLKVLVGMERHGIFLDIPYLNQMSYDVQGQIRSLEQEIYKQGGEVFNINSTQQLSNILQNKLHIKLPKKTATGYSTNADILEDLKDQHPIFNSILEYRTLEKLRSTYIENLPKEVNPATHRIHCTFNQSVAATGRLSCQDPNLQNIPVRTEIGIRIREAFRPQKKDWSYLAADYSQVELRLLAHLSEDPSLIKAFCNNEDIHAYTAATIFNVPLTEVTKEQRYKAKAVNFGIVYGQQAFGLAKELRIDVKEAAAIIDMYFKRYHHVKDYLEFCKEQSRKSGKAVTFTGRERSIPEINSRNGQLRMLAERLAVNTPIQGSQADLIKLAMLAIDHKLSSGNYAGFMILQIHDELIFEVPDEEIHALTPLVKESMQNVMNLKVPLIVNIAIGKNWKEC